MKMIAKFFSEHQGRLLQLTLVAIMLLFIGIMIGVYVVAKRANPVILDEKGQPKFQQQQ